MMLLLDHLFIASPLPTPDRCVRTALFRPPCGTVATFAAAPQRRPYLNKLSNIRRPGAPADSPDDGGGYLGAADTRQRALLRSLSCQRRGFDIRLLHQPIECRSAGLGHWFVRHSQSGERSTGFGGVLFGLECHKQRLGVFQHWRPSKIAVVEAAAVSGMAGGSQFFSR
jgi:hypothetical protein